MAVIPRPWSGPGAVLDLIDPVETSNPNVAGMLNTLPGRMLHAGVEKLYFPCLAADDPELWKFDGPDTESLVKRTLQLMDPRDEDSCRLVEDGYVPV